ncbi:MAG: Ig-like domain-containing protein [Candidatus Riflebacteria bacterium]|nr:Ig-like domain-containing protein [Candidatus Riflebacteria bacterium]
MKKHVAILSIVIVILVLWIMPGCRSSGGDAYYYITPSPTTVGQISGSILASNTQILAKTNPVGALHSIISVGSATTNLTPVPDAEVWLNDIPTIRTVTDSKGVYLLQLVPPGAHKVVAKYRQKSTDKIYKMISEDINLTTQKLESGGNNFVLLPATNVVSGILRTIEGTPLSFVTLTLWGESFLTDQNGYFVSPPIPSYFPENEIKIIPPTGFQPLTVTTPFQFDIPPLLNITLNRINPVNFAPTVVLSAEKDRLQPNETIVVNATATDQNPTDQKNLLANWACSSGKIASTTNPFVIYWTAPATEGVATLSVMITDPHGATAGVDLPLLVGITQIPIDTVAPEIAGISPASSSTEVASTTAITVIFTKGVIASSVQRAFTLKTDKDLAIVLNPPVADSQSRIFTFQPVFNLPTDTLLIAQIKGGTDGPHDYSGNFLSNSITWSFRTSDNPKIAEFYPPNKKSNVELNTPVSIRFTKSIDPNSINENSFVVSSGSEILPGTLSVSSDGKMATFSPSLIFPVSTKISASIATSVKDLNGLLLSGITSWSFTTKPPPSVLDYSPAPDSLLVFENTPVAIVFSDPMDAKALNSALSVKEASSGANIKVKPPSMSNDGTIATWDFYFPLLENNSYIATLKGGVSGAKNLLGIPITNDLTWQFQTAGVAPEIVSRSPADGQFNVPVKSSVSVVFSQAIDPTTINEGNFIVSSGSVPIRGTVTLLSGNKVASFSPLIGTNFPFSAALTAVIKPGIRDVFGNIIENEKSWNFFTEQRPYVILTSPANGATNIPIDSKVGVTFNKLITASTLNEQSFTLRTETYSIPGSVTVSVDGLAATFTPANIFAQNAKITGKISTDIKDENGNTPSSAFEWSFTIDPQPIVLSFSPGDGAPSIASETIITVQFSDLINESTINDVSFSVKSGGAPVGGQRYLSDDKKTLTFTPAGSQWPSGAQIFVSIATDVKSLFGAPLKQPKSWTFFTDTRPAVVSIFPDDNSVDVATNSIITVVLSKLINPDTLTSNNFSVDSNGNLLSGTIVQVDDRTIAFRPTTILPENSLINVKIGDGLKDLSGNPCTPKSWKFTTAANPRVFAFFPNADLVGVATSTNISAFFNKTLDLKYLTSSSFLVYSSGTTQINSRDFQISAGYNAATFTPESLPYGAQISVTIASSIRDLKGNGLLDPPTWKFVTDTQPAIVKIFPVENATDIPIASTISVFFSKQMASSTINSINFAVTIGGAPVNGSFALSSDFRAATFTPDLPFPFGVQVNISLTSEIRDTGRNPIPAKTWSFITHSRPAIVQKTPVNGTTLVATTPAVISVDFSEPMAFSSFSDTTFYVSSGAQKLAGTFNFLNNDQTVQLLITDGFPNNAQLTAHLTTGLTDQLGYTLLTDDVWSFTTDVKPFVTSFAIAPNYGSTTEIATGSTFTVNFSKTMRVSTLNSTNIILTQGGSSKLLDTFVIAPDQKSISFKAASPLDYGTDYTLTVKTSTKDDSGNDLQVDVSQNYHTDIQPAVVAGSIYPANATIVVEKRPAISATFSKTMDQSTFSGNNISIKDSGGNTIAGTFSTSATGFTFTPSSDVPKGKDLTVQIKQSVLDSRGNPLSAAFSWIFTTVTNIALAAGDYHLLVLSNNGAVNTCGDNQNATLGYTTSSSFSSTPAPITALGNSMAVVFGGKGNSAIIASDGHLFTCGLNNFGQIGDGTTLTRNTPVQVLDSVTSVAVGGEHMLAIKGGNAYSWGYNGFGQLGNGTTSTISNSTPVQIAGLSNVKSVAAGLHFSLALLNNGDVYIWGQDFSGYNKGNAPVKVNELSSISMIAAGENHAVALQDVGGNKTVYTWGRNIEGELGDGTTNATPAPISINISAFGSPVKQIAAGGYHTLALLQDGRVIGWGANSKGEITGASGANIPTPAQIVGISSIDFIAAGFYYSAALQLSNGLVFTWGDNSKGQLGRAGSSAIAASGF